MPAASFYISQVQELVHDSAGIDYTTVELLNFINNARQRVALDFHCVRQLFTDLTTVVNQEIYPIQGGVGGAEIVTGGSGYTNQTIAIFLSPPGAGTGATGIPVISSSGAITGINMTSWGSGYSNYPPGGLTGLSASVSGANPGAGNVISLTVGTGSQTSVEGYASGDTVTVANVAGTIEANGVFVVDVIFGPGTGRLNLRGTNFVHSYTGGGTVTNNNVGVFIIDSGGGTGATASTSNTSLGQILDILSISFIFGVQRTMLQWKPFTLFQAVFRANLNNVGQPAAWTTMTEANQFYIYPIPDQNYELEIDAIIMPNLLVNPTDTDTQILLPMADCVQFYAAHLALLKAQNFEQAEYMHKKYKTRQMEIQLTRQSRRISNPYQTFWRRLQRGF
jgi:hypothetical protein